MIRHHVRLLLLALAPLPLATAQAVTPQAAAVVRLQKALAEDEPARALAAIEACGRIAHDDVVKQLAKGLQHQEPAVQRATLLALRHNAQPAALAALLTAAGNEKLTISAPPSTSRRAMPFPFSMVNFVHACTIGMPNNSAVIRPTAPPAVSAACFPKRIRSYAPSFSSTASRRVRAGPVRT